MKPTILVTLGVIVVLLVVTFVVATAGMSEVKRLVIKDVDLSMIADGAYSGTYHRGRWTYDAQVAVADHKITSIKNTNAKMNMMKGLNDKIALAMINRQSPKVDVVSGASVNTKAFGMAVENALTAGLKK